MTPHHPSAPRAASILAAAFAVFVALVANEANLWSLRTSDQAAARAKVYRDEIVFSPDQADYLSPPISHAQGKGWRFEGHQSVGSHFARTPGYSLLYYPLYLAFGDVGSLRALKWLHLLLLGASVACLHVLLWQLTDMPRRALLAALLYGVLPIGANFVYQAMTEAVTPSYMIFYVSALMACQREKRPGRAGTFLILAGALWALLVFTRPVTGIVGILLPVYGLLRFGRRKAWAWLGLAVLPFLLAVGAWSFRNYRICGCFVPLEARHPSLFALWYGPSYNAFHSFTACWATNTEVNDYLKPLWDPALSGRASLRDIDAAMALIPPNIVAEFGASRLTAAFQDLQASMVAKAPYRASRRLPNQYLPEELRARDSFALLAAECRARHPVRYWGTNTMRYLGHLVLHSNTSSFYFFQQEYRHHWWLNRLRQGLGAGHVLLYVSLAFLPIFFRRESRPKFILYVTTFVLVPILFIGFFTLGYRSIEQRYMLPYLPILYLGVVTAIALRLPGANSPVEQRP